MAAPKGNKYAQGLTNSGRPPKYTDPKKLYDMIIGYFEFIQGEFDDEGECIRPPSHITITGLAIFLGFDSKSTLYEYAKKKEFSYSIRRAMLFVENNYEEMLFTKISQGAIFALKNMGWYDKQRIENINLNSKRLSSKHL